MIDAHITWVIHEPDFMACRFIGILGLTTQSNFLHGKKKKKKGYANEYP